MTSLPYDVVIVGAGPVGMSLAAGLCRRWQAAGRNPNRIALVDAKPLVQAVQDPRTLALADTSRMRLLSIGFPESAVPIHQVHVSETNKLGRVLMTAKELQREALGWTVSYGELIQAMDLGVQVSGANVLRGHKVVAVEHEDDLCRLELDNGQTMQALLHIDAEGGVYGQAGERDTTVDYQQTAFISQVYAQPTDQALTTAYERFTPEGPLALLPRSVDGSRYALVWCAAPSVVADRMTWSDDKVLRTLEALMGNRLSLTGMAHRLSFPLGLNLRRDTSSQRYAAVGNAAQILHPVAGQGLNLGLRDVDCLVRLIDPLCIEHSALLDAALADYSALRKADRTTVVQLTDWMARGFASHHPILSSGRQAMLMALELLPAARKMFANTMLFGWMRT